MAALYKVTVLTTFDIYTVYIKFNDKLEDDAYS